MSYTVEEKPELKAVLITYNAPFDSIKDTGGVAEYLMEALASRTEELHFVADFSGTKVSFGDLVSGMAEAYRTPGSPFSNPLLKTYTVANDNLIKIGVKAAAEQEQYGMASVKLYSSVEEALQDVKNNQ